MMPKFEIRPAKESEAGLVLDWNEPSIKFYKSLGAKPMEDWTIYRLDEAKLKEL
ncbi:MAG: hypothetical protein K6A73_10310 [Bacteroidales bacterium]|nr:hypothetical protein [Bacteroidales bacterium]